MSVENSGTVTVGEALVALLEQHGVEVVFGIPGVHTAELYRGLATSKLRHITPRHEQGAGFMADGYARVTGRPGVCFVITGPGLTNTITAMAQAREDSVPMLVISGVNARTTLGKGSGYLHELPDQRAMMKSFTKDSVTLMDGEKIAEALSYCIDLTTSGRPGPVHLEIPTDVMVERIVPPAAVEKPLTQPLVSDTVLAQAASLIAAANTPVVLAGGGACSANAELAAFAEHVDAPVVLTANGRGLMAGHALQVPASASLPHVRNLIAESDLVIAVGTELGQTDYDVYGDGGLPDLFSLIRVDVSEDQIAAGPETRLALVGDCAHVLGRLLSQIGARQAGDGLIRAANARKIRVGKLAGENQMRGDVAECVARCRANGPHCWRFNAAGLCRKSLFRSACAETLVQLRNGLWCTWLRAAGGNRGCHRRPGTPCHRHCR